MIGAWGMSWGGGGEEMRRDGTGRRRGAAAGGQQPSAGPPSEWTVVSRAWREELGRSARWLPPRCSLSPSTPPRCSGDHVSFPPGLAWPLADNRGLSVSLSPGLSSPQISVSF